MTTITLPAPARRFRASNVVRSEWTKLRSVRSNWWALGSIFVGTLTIGALVCAATVARWASMSPIERAHFDGTSHSLTGLFLAQLAVGVIGTLAITSEYGSGMIRSTLAAVSRRRTVLAAKAVAVAVPVLVVAIPACIGTFLAGQAILAGKAGVPIGAPGELRAVLGAALYLTVLSLLALGIGTILRHTAAALTTYVGLVLIVPSLLSMLPNPWGTDLAQYTPSWAGQALLATHPAPDLLAPWTGFAVLCAWAALALAWGARLIRRRDV